jgi:myo-inositol-1(or 4)-monophosphatase
MTDAELALRAAAAGAEIVKGRFGGSFDQMDKGGGDFATDVDLASEAAIIQIIRSERPHASIRAEESGQSGRGDGGATWLIDPMCGTANFAARTGPLAVNVAAMVDPPALTVAAVADPLADEVYWSDGRAAAVRRGGTDDPLRPSAHSRLVDVNMDPPFPNQAWFQPHLMAGDPSFLDQFGLRVVSTTLALTWVASGRRAAYVSDGWLAGSVHFAAPLAVCAAAGCVVTNLAGEPLHTGVGGLVAAADAETHRELMRTIRSVQRQPQ